jgi:uncharacterized membrane protein YfcA
VSAPWLIVSFVLSFVAAVLGGYVCALIAKSLKPPKVLTAVVLALGLVLAIPALMESGGDSQPRPETVDTVEAMQNAKQPPWVVLLTPFVGAVGVLLGARRRIGDGGGR